MEINKAAVALVVALCAGAGAGGAFLVSRGSSDGSDASEAAVVSSDLGVATVDQSEAVIDDAPAAIAPPVATAKLASAAATDAPRRKSTKKRASLSAASSRARWFSIIRPSREYTRA